MSLSIVCPACKDLVPVVEKTIAEHHDCPAGGMRYIPSPPKFQSSPGGPKIELVAAKPVQCECGESATMLLLKVTPPRMGVN